LGRRCHSLRGSTTLLAPRTATRHTEDRCNLRPSTSIPARSAGTSGIFIPASRRCSVTAARRSSRRRRPRRLPHPDSRRTNHTRRSAPPTELGRSKNERERRHEAQHAQASQNDGCIRHVSHHNAAVGTARVLRNRSSRGSRQHGSDAKPSGRPRATHRTVHSNRAAFTCSNVPCTTRPGSSSAASRALTGAKIASTTTVVPTECVIIDRAFATRARNKRTATASQCSGRRRPSRRGAGAEAVRGVDTASDR
jgi:hypothetical protein